MKEVPKFIGIARPTLLLVGLAQVITGLQTSCDAFLNITHFLSNTCLLDVGALVEGNSTQSNEKGPLRSQQIRRLRRKYSGHVSIKENEEKVESSA
jgi:hypothetical protein